LSKIKFMIACSINYSSNKSSNSLPDIF
jgi:hypothetical protein